MAKTKRTTDLDMLCKSTEDPAEVAAGIKERMNTYGLVMALLITLTWSTDGFGLEVSDDSLWGDAKADSKDSIITWYAMCLYISTASFILGVLSVVEILDRTAVTPLKHTVRFFLSVHDSYLFLPNVFLYAGVISFAAALLIQASVVLPAVKCVIMYVLVVVGILATQVQVRHGIRMNRSIVDDVVAQQSAQVLDVEAPPTMPSLSISF